MIVGCWGPRQQGHTSSSDYVTPVTAAPVRGCTPDCLREPVIGRHPSGRGIPVSLPRHAYARGLQARLPSAKTISLAPSLIRTLLGRYRYSPFLPSSGVDLPRGQTNPLRQRRRLLGLPSRSRELTTATPARSPFSLRSHGHHFRWKVLGGRVRVPGLTLQGAVRGYGEPSFSLIPLFFFFFLFFFTFSFARGKREILSRKSIR